MCPWPLPAMTQVLVVLLLGFCALFRGYNAAAPILATDELGMLKGVQEVTEDGRLYFAFKGIRYAEAPVGPLRFKEPKGALPVSDEHIVNATTLGHSCLQLARHSARITGNEDCLFVNVYTPSYLRHAPSYPVLVFIPGGAFMNGGGTENPSRVVARDIVVVTLNYRLGVLGFLSSGDEDLPGNLGLLDQQLALKWVQKNIHLFCGDRMNVTLAGQSSGAASTTLHMISPGSRGLFQRAIAMSGTTLNPWVQHFGDKERVRSVARLVGCITTANQPISDLLPCLRSVNGTKLVEAERKFQGWNELPFSPFGPVIDHKFIFEDPYRLLIKGKIAQVPLLLSVTTEEGLFPVAEFMKNNSALAELDQDWNELAPLLLDYEATAQTKADRDYTSTATRAKYFGDAPINNKTLANLIQLAGDRHFVAGADDFARTLASVKGSKPVYFYQYGYRAEFSVSEYLSNSSENYGVSHGDDLYLILPDTQSKALRTAADKSMSSSLVDVWESFIRRGIPVTPNFPVWKPVPPTGNELIFLNITWYTNATLQKKPELGHTSFWRSLPFKNLRGGAAATIPQTTAILVIVATVIIRWTAMG